MKMRILIRFYHATIFVLLSCVYVYQTDTNSIEVPQTKFLQLAMLTTIGLLWITKKAQDKYFRYSDFKRRDWLVIGAVVGQIALYYGWIFFSEEIVAAMSSDPVLRILMVLIVALVSVGPWAAALAAIMIPDNQ